MPAPDITPLPVAPQRSDEPATFVTKADAFVAALEDLPTEINAFGDYLDGLALSGVTGPITGTFLTMATARLLGRSTASTGAIEEIAIGSGLTLSAGTLASTGSYTDEQARDAIGAALVAGGGITITPNDGDDTITIAASGTGSSLADYAVDAEYFGDGSDGDVTINSGTTTLTRDMYYDDLTLSGTGILNPAGYRIHISGVLDISAAPAGAIQRNGNNGSNASSASGGGLGTATSSTGPLSGNGGASSGASGGTGAGAQAGAGGLNNGLASLAAGTSGKGGNVGATNGGAARAPAGGTPRPDLRRLAIELAVFNSGTFTRIEGGQGGPGGSAGAGDGVGSGGGGGGGGQGGSNIWIAARTIARGTNTTAGIIQSKGGNGGSGAGGTGGTNRGGGGGGAGASGGWITLIYRTLTGSTITGALDATGGGGGAGANGTGTGTGGDGGYAGGGGRIDKYDLGAGTRTLLNATAAEAGNAGSGSTGGAAKTATNQRADL